MELQEFAQKVRTAVEKRLGTDYRIQLNQVRKNNNINLVGLIIQTKGRNVYPTIYLEPFLEFYEDGMPLSVVVDKILEVYHRESPGEEIDFSFFEDFQKVKKRICYRLVNRERNKELLEQIPHIPYLDLAICFYYSYENPRLGKGSILIYNNHVKLWNTNTSELLKLAQKNTPVLYPAMYQSMESTLRALLEEQEGEWELPISGDVPMDILGNMGNSYGAVCMIYPGLLQQIAMTREKDFYILPCSVHEVILLWDDGRECPEKLQAMIREINEAEVEPEEVLSNSLYYYERKREIIKQII